MRARVILPWLGVCLCLASISYGEPATVNPADIEKVFRTLRAAGATEAPRVLQTDTGFLRYLGAPPGASYLLETLAAKSATPDAIGRQFLTEHGPAFGMTSECVDFRTARVTAAGSRMYARLQQTYDGLAVFGAQSVIQINDASGVTSILSDIMRDTEALDTGDVSTTPTVNADVAQAAAIAELVRQKRGYDTADLGVSSAPELMVYCPSVLGLTGPTCLVWHVVVVCPEDPFLQEVVLVDAHSGNVALRYSNLKEAKYRDIYDADNTRKDPGTFVRKEGDPSCGIEDADFAYDYLGDTYDFYWTLHGRDSIDGLGMTLSATVRACSIYSYQCPLPNAYYMSTNNRMYFGDGFVVDDVTGHELTHGVTDHESNLIYMGESGAINECFSDVWGEFIDLTNGRGNDTDDVRWYMGEDLPLGSIIPGRSEIRNMANPPEFGDPDRMGSPYWIPPSWWWYDNGGVHINSGVGNKLCYLLTDGDFFNGYSVQPLGEDSGASIARVAELFYELQTNLLAPASDYNDMYMQLAQATINLDYNFAERMNVRAAGRAVEINPPSADTLKGFRATPAYDLSGAPVIALTWSNPKGSQFLRAILVRGTGRFPESPEDGTIIYEGTDDRKLDRDVVKDAEYYYALFADFRTGFPEVLYARAVAGVDPPDTLTEAFEVDTQDILPEGFDVEGFVDLQGYQLEFTPIGAPVSPLGSTQYYTDYSRYEATVTKGIAEFPVPREDERGGAYRVPLQDLSGVYHGIAAPFPFFGGRYNQLWLSANGYVSFQWVSGASTNNFPSLEAHYAMPRISFLFAHLSPDTGGEIWTRSLDDRLVITFNKIPEWLPYEALYGAFPDGAWPNSVQLELFYSGKIRMTYLEVYATNTVCGLSDGNGVPVVLADIFPDVARTDVETDLSALPTSPNHLSLKPLPYQWFEAGEVVNFVAETISPNGVPWFSAEWDGPIAVPFADNGDGTGEFYWTSTLMDDGTYTVRVKAFLGDETAYQDVALYIGDPTPLPEATNVRLRSDAPYENPSQDRLVDVNSRLTAEYTYWHPLEQLEPERYSQGIPLLYWFKNEGLIPAFTNQWIVPASATRAGEEWFFTVIPRTASGVRGEEVMSPVVTILAMPTISGVTPASGPTQGGTTVTLTGERLGRPMSVTFGTIAVQRIRSVSDTQIEVVTPAHAAGVVNILVTTPEGAASLRSGFTYTDEGADIVKADVNGDGVVDALDVQLVLNAVLKGTKGAVDVDANRDGLVNSVDIQVVINEALGSS